MSCSTGPPGARGCGSARSEGNRRPPVPPSAAGPAGSRADQGLPPRAAERRRGWPNRQRHRVPCVGIATPAGTFPASSWSTSRPVCRTVLAMIASAAPRWKGLVCNSPACAGGDQEGAPPLQHFRAPANAPALDDGRRCSGASPQQNRGPWLAHDDTAVSASGSPVGDGCGRAADQASAIAATGPATCGLSELNGRCGPQASHRRSASRSNLDSKKAA